MTDGPADKKDAYAKREARKYDRPIPSREFILEVLADKGMPISWQQIAHLLNLHDPRDLEALIKRLNAMERDGQLIRNRREGYGIVDRMNLIRGYVIAHPDGFGFLVPDDGGDDLFLSARQMRPLIHGDRIVARVTGIDRRGRREGAVVEILQRNTHQVVGRFFQESRIAIVVPDNKRITHDIVIPQDLQGEARHNQIVVVQLVEQPSKRSQPIGKIVEVLGEHMAPGMEIDVAIRAHELPYIWPDDIQQTINEYQPQVQEADKAGRVDVRDTPLVTIDGADAKDFDDAVYCEPHAKGWRLLVAIADVSHYVRPGSALDRAATERGNSVYFPGRVIPMLPEILSNGLCSLNPQVDRLCMVCEMIVSKAGLIKSYRFYDAVMRSHARLIYDDVAALLNGDKTQREKYKPLVPHLENLYALYQALDKQRGKRGTIEFETTETVIQFDEKKKIKNIVPLVRNDAHKLIEECMISANICAAMYLAKHNMPLLFRVHAPPKADKLNDLRVFLSGFGLDLKGGADPTAADFSVVLEHVRGKPEAHLIQTVMLRSLNQAIYTPENVGHFGLALEEYAHFTSPIRRYPDLLIHRAIRHVLSGQASELFTYNHGEMIHFGEQCSMTERRADEATRDVISWLKCEYMQDKVGEEFFGIISGVTSFGLFVELENIYVEGLVHVTSLNNDYYIFDPVKHCLIGEHTREMFQLADRVKVIVTRVDLDDKRIDFELTDHFGKPLRKGKSRSKAATDTRHDKKKQGKRRSKKKTQKAQGKADAKPKGQSRGRHKKHKSTRGKKQK